MIAALVLLLNSQAGVAEPMLLEKLFGKVQEIGQKVVIEDLPGAFLGMKGKEVQRHSKFDSERQVLAYGKGKERRLIFMVPEKPFPEFGKVWVYSVSLEGKVLRGGVSDLRDPFKLLADAKANVKAAKIEAAYWIAELEIKP